MALSSQDVDMWWLVLLESFEWIQVKDAKSCPLKYQRCLFREQCTECGSMISLFRCLRHKHYVDYKHAMVRAHSYKFNKKHFVIINDYIESVKCKAHSECRVEVCGWCREEAHQGLVRHSFQLVKCPEQETDLCLSTVKKHLRSIVKNHRTN